jgi:hypothetical protein
MILPLTAIAQTDAWAQIYDAENRLVCDASIGCWRRACERGCSPGQADAPIMRTLAMCWRRGIKRSAAMLETSGRGGHTGRPVDRGHSTTQSRLTSK